MVYAKIAGNQGGSDGWNFRGRGFNQLTGRGNYRKYGQLSGVPLEPNPEMLNKNDIAAKIAVTFLLDGQSPSSIPKFSNKEENKIKSERIHNIWISPNEDFKNGDFKFIGTYNKGVK